MADLGMTASGGVQSRERAHHLDVGNPNRVVFINILQLQASPVVGELIAKQ